MIKAQTGCLLIGYYGKGNFGDQLMLTELVASLGNINKVIIAYSEVPFKIDNIPVIYNVKKCNVRQFIVKSLNIFKAFARTDIVIWGGGTCFYDNVVNGKSNLLGIAKIYLLSRLFRKKLIFLGVGIGEIIHPVNKLIVRYLLRNANLVTLRDSASMLYAANNVTKGNVYKTEDIAYLHHKPVESNTRTQCKIIFCGLSYADKQGYDDQFISMSIARILDDLVDEGYLVDFLPLHLGKSSDDEIFNRKVFDCMSKKDKCRIVKISPENQVEDTMAIINSASVVISMRLHGLVAGMMLGKKLIAISDSLKIHSMMADSGLACNVLTLDEICCNEASGKILKAINCSCVDTILLNIKRNESQKNIYLLKEQLNNLEI